MNIVKLQQRTMLLAGSVVDATRDGYGTANEGIDPNELKDGEWSWD